MSRHEKPIPRTNPSGEKVWVARPTDRHGKRHYLGTRKLRREAQRLIDDFYEIQGPPMGQAVTVGDYNETWLKRHPRTKRTNDGYETHVRGVLDVELDGVQLRDWPIADIRRRQAIDLLDHMLRKQGRAAKGALNILRALSAMWTDALDDDRADLNPFMGVKVRRDDPRVQKPARRIAVWSWQDMRQLAEAAGECEPMLRVIADCGVRIGELFPLERTDLVVNGCSDDCQVQGAHFHIVRTAWRQEISEGTKEDRLRAAQGGSPWKVGRVVPVPDDLLDLLLAMPRRIDTKLLFPGPTGLWGDRYWYTQVWYPARKQIAGMGQATPHEFRHSWISHLRAAGVDPADLAAMSGHTVETATRHYTHALGRSFDAARKAVGA